MKLYRTTDITASVRKAYEEFTHVVLNRAYTILKPVYYNTGLLGDFPVMQYASWIPASESQLKRWKNLGGVLIEQDWAGGYPRDVTVMVEAPLTPIRMRRCNWRNSAYGVIASPVSWRTHEECLDLLRPEPDVMRGIWRVAAGQQMTNSELASETGIPVARLMYLKNALRPEEIWCIQKRLAPERDEFVEAYDWLEGGSIPRRAVIASGFKAQIEEMARFGYISLKRINCYAEKEPDWAMMKHKREWALSELAYVRSQVESFPDHLA